MADVVVAAIPLPPVARPVGSSPGAGGAEHLPRDPGTWDGTKLEDSPVAPRRPTGRGVR